MRALSLRATCLALALLGASACTEKGRALVLVDLSTAVDVASLESARVVVVVRGNNDVVGRADATWDGKSPATLKLGVFVPKSAAGDVEIVACGFLGGRGVATSGSAVVVTVAAGSVTSATPIELSAGAPGDLCADADAGGTAGTSGGAGAGPDGGAGTSGAAGTGTAGKPGADGGAGTGAAGTGAAGTGAAGTGAAGSGAAGTPPVRAWGTPEVVAGNAALTEQYAKVAIAPSGKAVVVYLQNLKVTAMTYDPVSKAWGTPHPIDTRAGSGQAPSVFVDKNGVYLAMWSLDPGAAATRGVWWSSSADGVTWTAPASLTRASAFEPVAAMNADGAAVIAWTEQTTDGKFLNHTAAATRSATGAAWTALQVLRPADDQGFHSPAALVTGKGDTFVFWEQGDGGLGNQRSIWYSQHTASWTAAALFEMGGQAYNPSAAGNVSGQAIATWWEVAPNNSTVELRGRRFAPTTGFAAPVTIAEGNPDTIFAPALTLDDAGTATAAFAFKIQNKYQAYATRARATDATWPLPTALETDNAATNDDPNDFTVQSPIPVLGHDAAGNVTVLWRKRVGARFDLWTRRFPAAGAAWGAATLLESRDTNGVYWANLAVAADGSAMAVWHYEIEHGVWAAFWR